MTQLIILFIAYLLGSANTAVILAKVKKVADPRTQGSGNAGATNVLRTMGKQEAAIVLGGDMLKGLLAVLLARVFGLEGFILGLSALAVVCGHVFPLFHQFKGGKGVATLLGALLIINLWVALLAMVIWCAVTFTFRMVSLASIIAAASVPVMILLLGKYTFTVPLLITVALVIWKHSTNIERLRDGSESKVDLKKLFKKAAPLFSTGQPNTEQAKHEGNNDTTDNDNEDDSTKPEETQQRDS